MVYDIKNDIFFVGADAIIHQANCQHAMGSGIARFIADNFPEAKVADDATPLGESKLGTFSIAKVNNPKYSKVKYIINLYSQCNISKSLRMTSYDAMTTGLEAIRDAIKAKKKEPVILSIPYRIGSNRGGGDWRVVRQIIESVFADDKQFMVYVCEPLVSEPIVNRASR